MSDPVGELVRLHSDLGEAPSDEMLVRAARDGRRDSFDELVRRYQRRAVSVAYRLLGNLNDALEAVQDAFVRAYRNLATLEDASRFGPWFLRIVTTQSLNYRRARAVRSNRVSFEDCILDEDQSADELVSDSDSSEDRPGAQLLAAELQERVQAAMAELPEAQRAALVLFSIEQMPQKEVAEILECSVETVKWNVFQARKRLKEKLAEYV